MGLLLESWGRISSVQFSRSVVSNSLWPHESQHARPPCPSPAPRVHSDSHPLSQWCHPAISSSVVPFSSCLQSLPASESFPMSQLFAWCGQTTGVSALASFLPKKSQGWSSEWTGWSDGARSLIRVKSREEDSKITGSMSMDTILMCQNQRSLWGGEGNPLQYSFLENPLGRGAWWATVHRVTNSQTRLKRFSRLA